MCPSYCARATWRGWTRRSRARRRLAHKPRGRPEPRANFASGRRRSAPRRSSTPSETDGDDTIGALSDVDPAEPRRFGIPRRQLSTRARMCSGPRGDGRRAPRGFSCESGDLNGRWDKPVGDGLRKRTTSWMASPSPRGQTVARGDPRRREARRVVPMTPRRERTRVTGASRGWKILHAPRHSPTPRSRVASHSVRSARHRQTLLPRRNFASRSFRHSALFQYPPDRRRVPDLLRLRLTGTPFGWRPLVPRLIHFEPARARRPRLLSDTAR